MKVSIEDDIKSLYDSYIVREDDKLLYKIIEKKKIDDILEVYDSNKNLLIYIRKLNYFGTINFEIYKDDELMETVGEEINSFKEVYYFDTLGLKLEYNESETEYVVTDIEDKVVCRIKSFDSYGDKHFEIELNDEDKLLESIIISLLMYIYYKNRKDRE